MGKVTQVLICSAPRSGSTFLDMMLGGHSRVASLGEFSFLGKVLALGEACGCGQSIAECDEWDKVFGQVQSDRGIDLRRSPYALWQWDTRSVHVVDKKQQTRGYLLASSARSAWMALRETAPDWLRNLFVVPTSLRRGLANTLYLYDVIRQQWNVQIVVDSSKNLFKALSVYRRRPDSTKLIVLTRDGRGVLYSRRKTGISPQKSVSAWVKYYSRAQYLLGRHVRPEDRMIIRYEDLATDSEQTLRDLCAFLDIPYEEQMLQFDTGHRHVVNGNQGTKARQKFGIRLDEAWRDNLSVQDLAYFQKVAGRLSSDLGYEP